MAEFKILIADTCADEGLRAFDDYPNISYDVKTKHTEEELIAMIGEYDGMIVRSATKVTPAVIEAAKNMKVIARAGAGYDNIDVPAASAKKIAVLITPSGNTNAVVELVIGLMVAWARHIPRADSTMKAGKWEKKVLEGVELKGKTLGVVGTGRIGHNVARIARAFDMKTIGYDKFVSKEQAKEMGIELIDDFDIFLKQVDFLSMHVPVTSETKGMMSTAQFNIMKPTAVLINCARGEVVDEAALYSALVEKKIAGACIDVYSKEPADKNEFPFVELPNVICTPHLGASSEEAQVNVAVLAARQIAAWLNDRKLIDCVNSDACE